MGFDYINLERALMRNETLLKEIKIAKDAMERRLGRKLYIMRCARGIVLYKMTTMHTT